MTSDGGDQPTGGAAGGPVPDRPRGQLGSALRRAWVGYQQRLDEEMAAAGFSDRAFPDGRVLRLCSSPTGTTIAHIGRELGVTRQGAAKIVGALRVRGYVDVNPSPTSGREKTVTLTPKAVAYLDTQRRAARSIEDRLRAELGDEAFTGLYRLLDALVGLEDERLRDYLRRKTRYPGNLEGDGG